MGHTQYSPPSPSIYNETAPGSSAPEQTQETFRHIYEFSTKAQDRNLDLLLYIRFLSIR